MRLPLLPAFPASRLHELPKNVERPPRPVHVPRALDQQVYPLFSGPVAEVRVVAPEHVFYQWHPSRRLHRIRARVLKHRGIGSDGALHGL
jgi:hypothetical protein